jgi:hypothetical protein
LFGWNAEEIEREREEEMRESSQVRSESRRDQREYV